MTLAAPPGQKGRGSDPPRGGSRRRSKADYSAARLEQIEASYGAERRALKLSGSGDVRFGRRRCCVRRCPRASSMPTGSSPRTSAAEPVRALPALQALAGLVPHLPIPAQIELASEQVMLGGRPLQDIAAELHGDDKS